MSIYAMIKNGLIENVIEADGYRTSQIVKDSGGYDDAVCVDSYPVGIGSIYENGQFKTSEGVIIQRQKTELELLQEQLQATQEAVDFLLMGGM